MMHEISNNTYINWKKILSQRHSFLQPIYKQKLMCTALLGSPSPMEMEFISVPCNEELPMAGIVCMKRHLVKLERQIYGMTHMLVDPPLQSGLNNKGTHFNLDRLQPSRHILNASLTHLYDGHSGIISGLSFFKGLPGSVYQETNMTFYRTLKWPWKENWMQCNRSVCGMYANKSTIFCRYAGKNKCDCLMNLCSQFAATASPMSVRALTKYVKLPLSQNVIDSVTSNDNQLVAINSCEKTWMPLLGKCVKLVESQHSMDWTSTMPIACNIQGHSDTKVFVLTYSTDILERIFTDWSLGNRLVVFFNSVRVCVVYDSNDTSQEEGLSTCQDKQPKQLPYILCSEDMISTACPVGYKVCSSECVSELSWCDGLVDCKDAADEEVCQHLCSAAFFTNTVFCLNKCHQDNCTCDVMFFQCESGGCLNSGKLCDGINDCSDGSDEHFCPSHDLNTIASFGAETPPLVEMNISKQNYNTQFLKTSSLLSMLECDLNLELPCLHWDPVCYPVDKRCVYDHTIEGHLKYCRNGKHLLGCEGFQCSGTYKCTESYCVPTHKICDGIFDCPYRDDETECPVHTCSNMLHCGTRCVHPNEICDGIKQCDDGTDEQFCQPPECPSQCECLGHSVNCIGSYVDIISTLTGIVKILVIKNNHNFVLDRTIFSQFKFVLFLELSNSSIEEIDVFSTLQGLTSVIKLNISNNRLSSLGKNSFIFLANVRELDLSRNPLTGLQGRVLAGLKSLTYVYLHHTKLSFISPQAFAKSDHIYILDVSHSALSKILHFCLVETSVDVLDMRGNVLTSSEAVSYRCLEKVSTIVVDQKGVCCLNVIRGKCDTFGECKPLLTNNAYIICIYTAVVFIAVVNVVSLIFNLLVPGPDSALVANLALANVFMVFPLCAVTKWNTEYDTEITFYETLFGDNDWCRASGIMLILSTQVGSSVKLLISVVKCYGVLTITRNTTNSIKIVRNMVTLSVWIFWLGICVALAVVKETFPIQEVSECFLFQQNSIAIHSLLILCATADIVSCLVSVTLLSTIMRAVLQSANLAAGHRHGGVPLRSMLIRLLVTSLTTILSLIPPGTLFLLWAFDIVSGRVIVHVAIVVCAIQPVTNPIIYTFGMPRFQDNWLRLVSKIRYSP